MTRSEVHNSLKKCRKKSGLTQAEVGFLLGQKGAADISRYEQRHSTPNLPTLFAYSSIFGVLPDVLFTGIQQRSTALTTRRIRELLTTLRDNAQQHPRADTNQRKVAWLAERLRVLMNDKLD